MFYICIMYIQFIFITSTADISKYPPISKEMFGTHFHFFSLHFNSCYLTLLTTGISKKIFWDQNIHFEISVV